MKREARYAFWGRPALGVGVIAGRSYTEVMTARHLTAVGCLLAAGAIVPLLAHPQQAHPSPAFVACGVERWKVKTLQDRPILRPTKLTSLRYLITRRLPAYLPNRRLPFERNVFTVVASVVLVRAEPDGDLHVVLRNGNRQMIGEAPAFACTGRALPQLRRAMAAARSQLRICGRARVTGVAFFDYDHGQTGVAPNAIELHPILGFHCLR